MFGSLFFQFMILIYKDNPFISINILFLKIYNCKLAHFPWENIKIDICYSFLICYIVFRVYSSALLPGSMMKSCGMSFPG